MLYSEDGCSISLSYSLVINEEEVSLDRRFADLGLEDESVVTLWKTMVFRDEQGLNEGTRHRNAHTRKHSSPHANRRTAILRRKSQIHQGDERSIRGSNQANRKQRYDLTNKD